MPNFDKAFARLAAHALCRRIGGQQFRMLRLGILQLAHQLVELGITDLRLIENVIQIFVVPDLLAKSLNLFSRVFAHRTHCQRL